MSRWRTWGEIPTFMKNDFTLKYYRHLSRKRTSMVFKRIFDMIMSAENITRSFVMKYGIFIQMRKSAFSA